MTISNDKLGAEAMIPTNGASEIGSNGANAPSKKLHGRAFYESIGSPKFILAPMVDQSEFAWRMLSRSFMTPESNKSLLAYSPMFHARMFSETAKFRDLHFQPLRTSLTSQPDPSSPPSPKDRFLDGNPKFDRPLFVQFCANEPDELLESAKYVAPFCDAVDLNLGCPQGIARKGKYGAFLQEHQDLIFNLINKLHKELDIPVTAKIRILETKEKTLEYAQMVVRAGASILTVHGRTRDMKGHKTGLADWQVLKFLRESLPKEIVMFANGNVLGREDIDECLRVTGVDGVMSAEGNLYNPAIFSEVPAKGEEGREFWRGKGADAELGGWRMDAVLRRYLDIIWKYVLEVEPPKRTPLFKLGDPVDEEVEEQEEEGPPKKKQRAEKKPRSTNPNMISMQPHCFKMLRPLVSKYHNIRDALAKCRAGDMEAYENVLTMTEKAVKEGILEYERTNGESYREEVERGEREREEKMKKGADGKGEGSELQMDESSLETVRKCKRPWWVIQAYVRPLPTEALAKGSLTLGKKDKGKEKGEAKGKENKEVEDVKAVEDVEEVKVRVGEGVNDLEEVPLPANAPVCASNDIVSGVALDGR
ncbi:tRNA dihydrouridine synthase [Clarireedia jacksonii]